MAGLARCKFDLTALAGPSINTDALTSIDAVCILSITMLVFVASWRNGAINPTGSTGALAITAIIPVLIFRRSMSRAITWQARQWGWDLAPLAGPSISTD